MISLNDYLYNGDTVIKILHNYTADLRMEAKKNGNLIDSMHSNLLLQMTEILEHNDFLTSQAQRMREFYKYMTETYPDLAFTFKGRIKSLIRAEAKFNGQIVSYIYDYHRKNREYPSVAQIKERLSGMKDLIAYRIIIAMPKCHEKDEEERRKKELAYLYDIANKLPAFLEDRGFDVQPVQWAGRDGKEPQEALEKQSPLLDEEVRPYYKDYIANAGPSGYQSLHVTFYDNISRSYIEVQLRTYEMDVFAEIGPANHLGYEDRQKEERARRDEIPVGECQYFDDAYERVAKLQSLKLNELDVNMFAAVNNSLINDGCGLFRGRLIMPYEHLSRFQNDLI
ncbi:MAG: guanosine polyphosphate pyrophosphohydrolase [Lachnospiraceae bacterium]